MRFSDIPGHDDVKQHLRALVDNGHLPHALLLEGPEGTAKFALARALAQYIHCSDRHDGEACGVCPSCRQHASFRHIDTIFSFPVIKRAAGKPTLSDDYLQEFTSFVTEHPWMDFDGWLGKLQNPNTLLAIYVDEGAELTRRLSYTAHASKYKIVLMWLPERMQTETANKMLKLLEEPFADTLFIMTSDRPRMLLPTIYSRVQRVAVKRYDNATLAHWLSSENGIDTQAAADIAIVAEGNINKALNLIGTASDNDMFLDNFTQLMRLAYQKKIGELKAWSLTLGAGKREPLTRFLDYCLRMLRENFMANMHRPELNVMTAKEQAFANNFSRFINERNVLPFYEAFSDARNDIASNANAKIVLFDLAVTVVLMLRK